jgi:hypothetical protein
MTVKQRLQLKIFYKTIILLVIAVILGALCYYTNSHEGIPDYGNSHIIYTFASIGISVGILAFIAWKIRYFHDIFAREWTGTVVSVRRDVIHRAPRNGAVMSMDDLVMVVHLDKSGRKVKLRLPYQKVGKVYCVGDRVHRLKGTRYPINLTREVEQHICPICARNSCYDDYCPDCRVKY